MFTRPIIYIVLLCTYLWGIQVCATKYTNITLNGEPKLVYFNDGDTFRIVNTNNNLGKNRARAKRVRPTGFNTLENYGPIHRFPQSVRGQLYDNAQAATEFARAGSWNCRTEHKSDGYGRLLAVCDDLALALIERGLAHVYSINSKPGDLTYIAAQMRAQKKKLGMWQYGVPDYIITSLHSAAEGAKKPYNRMISTKDGHSKKSHHFDTYDTCQQVCEFGSCMVYVPYRIRYGKNRPDCLWLSKTKG